MPVLCGQQLCGPSMRFMHGLTQVRIYTDITDDQRCGSTARGMFHDDPAIARWWRTQTCLCQAICTGAHSISSGTRETRRGVSCKVTTPPLHSSSIALKPRGFWGSRPEPLTTSGFAANCRASRSRQGVCTTSLIFANLSSVERW